MQQPALKKLSFVFCFVFYWNTPLCLVFFHSYNGCELIYTRFQTILHQLLEYSCANQNQLVMPWVLYEKRIPTGFCSKDFWSPHGVWLPVLLAPGGIFNTLSLLDTIANICLQPYLCNICSHNRLSGDLQISKDRAAEAKAKAMLMFSWFAHPKEMLSLSYDHMFNTTGAYLG